MGSIIVSKNGTIITPYKKGQSRSLEKATGHYDQVYHKWIEETGFIVGNYQGEPAFITHGLPKASLQQFLGMYSYYKLPETPAKLLSEPFYLNPNITLREYQGDIAAEIVGAREKYKEFFINLQTGYGKTLLGIYLAATFGYKTMVVCFLSDILTQWKDSLMKHTGINPDKFMYLNSMKTLDKIRLGELDVSGIDIFLISPNMLSMYLNQRDYGDLNDVFSEIGVGFLIFDEGHHNMGTIVKVNAVTNVRYTLYLSADYAQGDSRREYRYLKIFNNALVVKPKEEVAVDMRRTTVIVVDYDTQPTANDIASIYSGYGYNANYYMKYEMKKGRIFEVMNHLMRLIEQATKPEYKTLILFTNIASVDKMYEYLEQNVKSNVFRYGKYHSQMSDEEKTTTLDFANVIIATYSSFGTGRDLANIKYIIGTNQSNKIEDNQAAGRGRPLPDGSDTVYFIVTDTGFSYCRKKLKVRLGYLKETKMSGEPTVYHM